MKAIKLLLAICTSLIFHLSYGQFEQNPCLQSNDITIVILGSSTAAGAGPSNNANAWVNRYRRALQKFNPNNQVINLAVGGYTTYQIMPSTFVPPAGRPNANIDHNITKALSFQPDAILVNMPSNDSANGFLPDEQMGNFEALFNEATGNNVPIWICTTQPRNLDATRTQYQIEVRDSILSRFQDMAIDFWSGFANSQNGLDSFYDSGDGTHMNDTAHAIMSLRVLGENLPLAVIEQGPNPDYLISAISAVEKEECTTSRLELQLALSNIGSTSSSIVDLSISSWGPNSNMIEFNVTASAPSPCSSDTIEVILNAFYETTLNVQVIANGGADKNQVNDTSLVSFSFLEAPEILPQADTTCIGGTVQMSASGTNVDSVTWFDTDGQTVLSREALFVTPVLLNSTEYFVQGRRGPFHFSNDLMTTDLHEVDFNGCMFDVIAKEDLVIDSLYSKISSIGPQSVNVYVKSGGHVGYEESPMAWSFIEKFDILVTDTTGYYNIGPIDLSVDASDTLGVYLHLDDAGSNLVYDRVPTAAIYESTQMTLVSGTGKSHNFGDSYFPRAWNGQVFYHYGNKPEGSCSTEKMPVEAVVSKPMVELGPDTSISHLEVLVLSVDQSINSILWSDGSTGSEFEVRGDEFINDTVLIVTVEVTDDFGCVGVDSISVAIGMTTAVGEMARSTWIVSPNPVTDQLSIRSSLAMIKEVDISFFNLLNQPVIVSTSSDGVFDVSTLPSGAYFVCIRSTTGNDSFVAKFVKSK